MHVVIIYIYIDINLSLKKKRKIYSSIACIGGSMGVDLPFLSPPPFPLHCILFLSCLSDFDLRYRAFKP